LLASDLVDNGVHNSDLTGLGQTFFLENQSSAHF